MRFFFITVILLTFALGISAQNDSIHTFSDTLDLSLEEILSLKVSVAGFQKKSVIEAPSIVSIITEKEIDLIGARNLHEILEFVPGFGFGAELDNVVGIGIRGNNATEGKVLVLFDGHELNETNFGSFDFGKHIPSETIERIEIIRGPGSPVYGGTAEMAVISIVSKKKQDLSGLAISSQGSVSRNKFLSGDLCLSSTKKAINKISIQSLGYYSTGNRGNSNHPDFFGNPINYSDSSNWRNFGASFGIQIKNLDIDYLFDLKEHQNLEKHVGSIYSNGHYVSARYSLQLNSKLRLLPIIKYKRQKPWNFTNFPEYMVYNSVNSRISGNLSTVYNFAKNIEYVGGFEINRDIAEKIEDSLVFSNAKNKITYSSFALFSELVIRSYFAYFTVGARYELHESYGSAFVPRFAVTKNFARFRSKLLISRAFKAPTIQNIEINKDIKPEYTNTIEFETGFQFEKNMSLNVNLFYLDIRNAIVYLFEDNKDQYINYKKTGTYGLESEFKIKQGILGANFNYSLYLALKDNDIPDYSVENTKQTYNAYPNHKVTGLTYVQIPKDFIISMSGAFFSERYMTFYNETGQSVNKAFSSLFLLNFFVEKQSLFHKSFDFKIGVKDVFDQNYPLLNAYKANIEPIYDAGREFFVQLSFKL